MSFLASNAAAEEGRSGRRTLATALITASLALTGATLFITLDALTSRYPGAEGSALYYGPILAGPALPGAAGAAVAAMFRRREPTVAVWCALTAVLLSLGATAWASLLV
jgi:hypothetical protein